MNGRRGSAVLAGALALASWAGSGLPATASGSGQVAAVDDTVTVADGQGAVRDLLANDTAPTGASFVGGSLRLVDPSTGAAVTSVAVAGLSLGITSAGEMPAVLAVEPDDDAPRATTTVEYTVRDTTGATHRAAVSVRVVGGASDDTASTTGTAPVALDVLANDEPSVSGGLTGRVPCVREVHGPELGDCASEAAVPEGRWTVDGPTVRFVPAAGFAGTAEAVYDVKDSEGVAMRGSMEVQVAPGLPVATMTTPSLSTSRSATLALPVTWTGSGGAAGGLTYAVQYRLVGVSADGEKSYSTPATLTSRTGQTAATYTGTSGRVVQFRVRATDSTGRTGPYSAWRTTTFPVDDVSFRVGDLWRTGYSSDAYLARYRVASAAGATISRPQLRTDRISVIGATTPSGPPLYVYVDGALKAVVDTHSSTLRQRRILWSGAVSYGAHDVTLVVAPYDGAPGSVIIDGIAAAR